MPDKKRPKMKNVLFTLVTSVFLFSCGDRITENTMTVSGTIKGLKKGTLYLQNIPDSTLTTIDSLQINGDGSFSFQTEIESPEIFYLYLNKKDNNAINDRITFFGEPGLISIQTAWNTFDTNAKITGSKSNLKLVEFQKVMSKFNKKSLEILQTSIRSEFASDSLKIDSLQQQNTENTKRGYRYAINFAINNKDSYVSPYVATTEIPNANVVYLDSIYNSLSPNVADSKYGKKLEELIRTIKTK